MTIVRNGQRPEARGQALWILSQLGGLTKDSVLGALNDPFHGVRIQALKLSSGFINDKEILNEVVELADDTDAQVRMQVAYSLGESSSPLAGETLLKISSEYVTDPLMTSAVLSSAVPHQLTLAEKSGSEVLNPELNPFLRGLLQTAIGTNNNDALSTLLNSILTHTPNYPVKNNLTAYLNYRAVLNRFSSNSSSIVDQNPDLNSKEVELFSTAYSTANDPTVATDQRKLALLVLSFHEDGITANTELALKLLGPSNPTELQLAAVDSLATLLGAQAPAQLLKNWKAHLPKVRNKIVNTLLSRNKWTVQLLQAAVTQTDIAKSFSITQNNQLRNHRDLSISQLAESIFHKTTNSNRQQLIENYQLALKLDGDPIAGRGHFTNLCSTCHAMDGIGVDVGPNLTALSDKSSPALLTAILDPNRAVEDKFIQFIATSTNNQTAVGILSDETTSNITLTTTGGLKQTMLRQNMRTLESSSISLMPEGLELGLDHQAMADLLAFLNASDDSLKIRADADGSLGLTASRGTATGPSVYYNSDQRSFDYISESDVLEWTAYDVKAGYYDIFADAALAVEYEGRPFKLSINDSFVTGAVVFSRGIEKFRQRKFGNVLIEEDLPQAVFKLQHQLDGPQLSVRELRLIPVP